MIHATWLHGNFDTSQWDTTTVASFWMDDHKIQHEKEPEQNSCSKFKCLRSHHVDDLRCLKVKFECNNFMSNEDFQHPTWRHNFFIYWSSKLHDVEEDFGHLDKSYRYIAWQGRYEFPITWRTTTARRGEMWSKMLTKFDMTHRASPYRMGCHVDGRHLEPWSAVVPDPNNIASGMYGWHLLCVHNSHSLVFYKVCRPKTNAILKPNLRF